MKCSMTVSVAVSIYGSVLPDLNAVDKGGEFNYVLAWKGREYGTESKFRKNVLKLVTWNSISCFVGDAIRE